MTNRTTMSNESNIERVVMRRVHTVHALKPLVSIGTLAVVVLVAALWAIGREVWVARVLENAPHNISALPHFYLAAFSHTRLVVQILSAATLAALILLARETARFVSNLAVLRMAR